MVLGPRWRRRDGGSLHRNGVTAILRREVSRLAARSAARGIPRVFWRSYGTRRRPWLPIREAYVHRGVLGIIWAEISDGGGRLDDDRSGRCNGIYLVVHNSTLVLSRSSSGSPDRRTASFRVGVYRIHFHFTPNFPHVTAIFTYRPSLNKIPGKVTVAMAVFPAILNLPFL